MPKSPIRQVGFLGLWISNSTFRGDAAVLTGTHFGNSHLDCTLHTKRVTITPFPVLISLLVVFVMIGGAIYVVVMSFR